MKIIEKLSEKIEDEICDAKSYAKMALEYKDEFPELSKALYNLSLQEMDHMGVLHENVVRLIDKYKEEKGDPPASMLAVYDYLHKQQIEKASDVKNLQGMYKK